MLKNDEKKCPACAEAIKAEAKVCKNCGHVFSDEEVAAAVAKAKSNKRSCAVGCLAPVVIVIAGLIWLSPSDDALPSSDPPARTTRPMVIDEAWLTPDRVGSPTVAKPVAGTCPAGDVICPGNQKQLTSDWPKALAGNYGAARNVAYAFSVGGHATTATTPRPIQACAWRLWILASGSPEIASGDRANYDLDCGRLDDADQERAQEVADVIADRARSAQ